MSDFTLQDERAGLPSASSMERRINCPGSAAAELDIAPEAPSTVAQFGTKVHGALEYQDVDGLTLSETEVTMRLVDLEERAVVEWMSAMGIRSRPAPIREERLWVRDPALNPMASAKIDVGYIEGSKMLILDYKSGFRYPTNAARNWQVRTQVLAAKSEYPDLDEIWAGTATARLGERLDLVAYRGQDFTAAQQLLDAALWWCREPDAPRRAGKWCQYCRAKATCPQALQWAISIAQIPGIDQPETCPPMVLREVWHHSSTIVDILEAVKEHLKGLDAETLLGIGMVLGADSKQAEVSAALALPALMARNLCTAEEFVRLCSVGVGALKELLVPRIRAADPTIKSNKAAEARLIELLGAAVSYKDRRGSLRVV